MVRLGGFLYKIYHTYGVSWIFEKPNLPQNMGVIRLSAFDNFEFDNRDHHFWYSLTQGFPKIYHTYAQNLYILA